jgi:hypothetical protein
MAATIKGQKADIDRLEGDENRFRVHSLSRNGTRGFAGPEGGQKFSEESVGAELGARIQRGRWALDAQSVTLQYSPTGRAF